MRYALLLVASTAFADGKPAPDKYTAAAKEAFDQAHAADDKGKLDEALRLYRKANEISPNAATVYNIADVERRMTNLDDAIRDYMKYLDLARPAPDEKVVQELVNKLYDTPGTLLIDSEREGSLFVDGVELAGTPPVEHDARAGERLVEVVTPVTYGYTKCTAIRGIKRICKVHAPARADGNVILSVADKHGWDEQKIHWEPLTRMQVPAGHYTLAHVTSIKACKPVELDAPADGLLYVHIEISHRQGCDDLAVTTKLFSSS